MKGINDKILIEKMLQKNHIFYEKAKAADYDQIKIVDSISPEAVVFLFGSEGDFKGCCREIIL